MESLDWEDGSKSIKRGAMAKFAAFYRDIVAPGMRKFPISTGADDRAGPATVHSFLPRVKPTWLQAGSSSIQDDVLRTHLITCIRYKLVVGNAGPSLRATAIYANINWSALPCLACFDSFTPMPLDIRGIRARRAPAGTRSSFQAVRDKPTCGGKAMMLLQSMIDGISS